MNDSQSPTNGSFQTRVHAWMLECFGETIAADHVERNHRFLEEVLELVQANGCTQSEAHQLVDYVYGRDQGDINQEVGGVMVTLAALCSAIGEDMSVAGETELARVWTKIEKIRAKQAAKPKHSPLPTTVPFDTREAVLREAAEIVRKERMTGIPPLDWNVEKIEIAEATMRATRDSIAAAILAAIPAPAPPQSRKREVEAALELAGETLHGVAVFVKSSQRIKSPEGDDWFDERVAQVDAAIATIPSPLPPQSGEREAEALKDGRWYLGAMNDGLFIIDEPPRPAPNDTGPSDQHKTRAICGALDNRNAELIVKAHNAALDTMRAREGK